MADYLIFLDESYTKKAQSVEVKFGAWGVELSRLQGMKPQLSPVYRTPVAKSICKMFESLDAVGLLTSADLDCTVFRANEIDGTDDVRKMKRPDTCWSTCATFTIAYQIMGLAKARHRVGNLDVYFDPKSLTASHRSAFESHLRNELAQEVCKWASAAGIDLPAFAVREIQWPEKASDPQARDIFQFGVWVADQITRFPADVGCIVRKDFSEIVRKTVKQFDGDPYFPAVKP